MSAEIIAKARQTLAEAPGVQAALRADAERLREDTKKAKA